MINIMVVGATASIPGVLWAASTNMIINGSFEDPVLGSNSWSQFPAILGWVLAFGCGIEVRNNVAGSAYDGKQFIELDSYCNSGIMQRVSTQAGIAYTLSFRYSPRPNTRETNDIKVFWNDSQLGPTLSGSNSDSTHHWTKHTFNVIGTGGVDNVKFAASGVNDKMGGSLDAVSITTNSLGDFVTDHVTAPDHGAPSLSIFRCRDADSAITFTDKPCPTGWKNPDGESIRKDDDR